MPITQDEINGHNYFEYINPPRPNSQTPSWGIGYGFPNAYFSTNSYLTIEIWNQIDLTNQKYVGGVEMTISQLETLPSTSFVEIFDQNDQSVGSVNLSWKLPTSA